MQKLTGWLAVSSDGVQGVAGRKVAKLRDEFIGERERISQPLHQRAGSAVTVHVQTPQPYLTF